MKKVIVANYRYFISGGPEVYMYKFIDKSKSIDYDSIPFSVNYSQNLETPYSKYFISSRGGDSIYYNQIKRTPKSILKTLKCAFYNREAVKKINKLIKDEKPEVLYALQIINTISPSIFKIAKKKGLKVIHRISDFNLICPKSDLLLGENTCELCVKGNFNNCVRNKCYHNSKLASIIRSKSMKFHRKHKLYDYVDYFVTPTEFTRSKLIEGGFPANKIIKIPTFIDSTLIEPNYSNDGYLLFLGRLVPEKGVKYAIEAMKYLSEYPQLKLKITGELDASDYSRVLKKLIIDNDLEDRIEFVGFLRGDELKKLISNSVCILCPAIWYENMPNTVIEAYAYGKPVVASNIGCFPEIVKNGITGYLFENKNSVDLSAKIKLLLDDDYASIIGYNARKEVENEYSPSLHMTRLKELFESSN